MSQTGDASAGAAFDLGKLERSAVSQLRQFCKNLACPIKGSTRKEEPQKALRPWVTTKEAEGQTEEKEEEEEVQSIHNGIVGGLVMSRERLPMAGSSVSGGLTPEELQDRQAERAHQLELENFRIQREMEERRMAIEEKKILLAHELSWRELDQRSHSNRDGGSNITVQPERRMHIPKDLVKDLKRKDDIFLWLKG
ncbi:hypothetical protein NDU88_002260 [Pleurodeles waltl]|uniref:Uncharacterized protein n=1 Tax=Pleurodeles waltl TaxID=8319 RepID=A0AAV7WKR0_PLEWA|nr:hypothetical protein NDU88_002260 [Pleurodeles waltl]